MAMPAVSDLLKVSTTTGAPLNAKNVPSAQGAPEVSNLVTVQSLGTFAVAVPVLKTIWELVKSLHKGGWAKSFWTPFLICVVYALWQFAISLSGLGLSWTPGKRWTSAMAITSTAVIATANAAILAAAVLGLTETTS